MYVTPPQRHSNNYTDSYFAEKFYNETTPSHFKPIKTVVNPFDLSEEDDDDSGSHQ